VSREWNQGKLKTEKKKNSVDAPGVSTKTAGSA
jgi:hypothetical protein